MKRIELTPGNVLMIGLVSASFLVLGLAVLNKASKTDLPVVGPTARGFVDFLDKTTNGKAA
jgi:hypothetical protein